jgi:acyl transferase domain-containing protein
MVGYLWIVAALLAVAAVGVALVWTPVRTAVRESRLAAARRDFHRHREWLEAKFLGKAADRVPAESPRWLDCDFDNDVAYVRNRATGELAAFVAVTIAIDDSEATGRTSPSFRAGTAVFRLDRKHRWDTEGLALLNLTPAEAIRFYQDDLEIVAQEVAR